MMEVSVLRTYANIFLLLSDENWDLKNKKLPTVIPSTCKLSPFVFTVELNQNKTCFTQNFFSLSRLEEFLQLVNSLNLAFLIKSKK